MTAVRFFMLTLVLASAPAIASEKLKSIVENMRPGEWRELPNTSMSAAFPRQPEHPAWGVMGPVAVLGAWGGAAYDTKRNAFVFNGGGHGDYGGNEVYAFWLEQLRWERVTEPSKPRTVEGSQQWVNDDGTPISVHSYDGLHYLPTIDRIARVGGSEWRSGWSIDKSLWLFDLATRRWERRAGDIRALAATAYDPLRETLLVVTNHGVSEYDPLQDRWAARVAGEGDYQAHIAVFDPTTGMLLTNSYKPGLLTYARRADGSFGRRTAVPTHGDTEVDGWRGAEYDPLRKTVVAWNGGRETAYLDVRSMTWTKRPNAKGPAPSMKEDWFASGAIYGRWRYVPKYDLFIGYNHPGRNVWLWKPVAADAK